MAGITWTEVLVMAPTVIAVGMTAVARVTSRVTPAQSIRIGALTLLVPGVGALVCLGFLASRLRHPVARPTSPEALGPEDRGHGPVTPRGPSA